MSRKVLNECVDCGLHCLGNSCPNRNVVRIYCDECGEEVDELYLFEGQELCSHCVLEKLERVDYNYE